MVSDSCRYLGVDVGGTNIKIGIIDDDGQVHAKSAIATEHESGPQAAIERTVIAADELLRELGMSRSEIKAVGLGTPGTMDVRRGLLLNPPNLPSWRDFPVRDVLSQAIDRPVAFLNDANAAALGEYWIGSGSQFNSLVFLTLGTGVGGGIIVRDRLIEGEHSLGGECGHVTIDWSPDARMCGCGQRGHLEAYASAPGLVETYRRKHGDLELGPITARQVAERAEGGDEQALQSVMMTADFLARGIAIFGHILDPDAVILGGAMNFGGGETELGKAFLKRVRIQVKDWTFPAFGEHAVIDFARLGGDAGWIGAAAWARQQFSSHEPGPIICDSNFSE